MSKTYDGPGCGKCGCTERYESNDGCVRCIRERAQEVRAGRKQPTFKARVEKLEREVAELKQLLTSNTPTDELLK